MTTLTGVAVPGAGDKGADVTFAEEPTGGMVVRVMDVALGGVAVLVVLAERV